MAKQTYAGVNGIARKVKGGAVGVADTARKLKRAYIGVGGVARPCWNGGVPTAYGAITSLSAARETFPAGRVGDYAVFGGLNSAVVDAYSSGLTRTRAGDAYSYGAVTAASGANHVLLSCDDSGAYLYAYDANLTRTRPAAFSGQRDYRGGGQVGGYALFIGGQSSLATGKTADAYSANLTRTTHTVLSVGRNYSTCGSSPTHVIVSHGNLSSACAYVDAVNAELTGTKLANSTVSDYYGSVVSVGEYGLICTRVNHVVEAYDADLTRTLPAATVGSMWLKRGSPLGDFGILPSDNGIVETYDEELVHATVTGTYPHGVSSVITVGEYAILAGGLDSADAEAFILA